MKSWGAIIGLSIFAILSFSSLAFGYTMADYWVIKEGQIGVFNDEIIVVGPETRTFGTYSGREHHMSGDGEHTHAYIYVGMEGVLVVALHDMEEDAYIDLSGSPIVLSNAQMNVGDTVSTLIPAGIIDSTEISVDFTLEALEDVTVPAGTFTNCLKMKIDIDEFDGIYAEYIWLAKGVGIVQVFRSSQTFYTEGCFFSCAAMESGHEYSKLKGYVKGDKKVIVIPLE